MLNSDPDNSYLAGISVNEPYRGQGLGEYMLQRCIEISRTAGRKKIVFYTINDQAHAFYDRFRATLNQENDNFWLGEIELNNIPSESYQLPEIYTERIEEGEITLFMIGGIAQAFDERYCFIIYIYEADKCIASARIKI